MMMDYQPFGVLKDKMQHVESFVFVAEEDFGITPVKAQACGTPVIAYGRDGALETVKDGETGCFFKEQTTESIIEAVNAFDKQKGITSANCRKNAETFSIDTFCQNLKEYINERI
ncbi:glycosyltransferase [Mitsuokella multacida]